MNSVVLEVLDHYNHRKIEVTIYQKLVKRSKQKDNKKKIDQVTLFKEISISECGGTSVLISECIWYVRANFWIQWYVRANFWMQDASGTSVLISGCKMQVVRPC